MNAQLNNLPLFRPMNYEDLPDIINIENQIYPFPWTLGNFRDSLQAGYSSWVYQYGDYKVAYGVMMLAANEAHLLNMSVSLSWQRQGIGTNLLYHLLKVAREYKAGSCFLEVRPSNIAAYELYKKFGFKEINVRRDYYPAHQGRENAIVMSLPL